MEALLFLVVVVLLLLLSRRSATAEVCLQPRFDIISHDRGSNTIYNGQVQVVSDLVARNRLGIFSLAEGGSPKPVGDHFGSNVEVVALADQGKVVAVSSRRDGGSLDAYVSVLRREENDTLTRVHILAHSLRDSIPEMGVSMGGLALNDNGTLLATSFIDHGANGWDDVALFHINVDAASNVGVPPRPIERVPGARAGNLVLSSLGDVLIAADDACEVNSEQEGMARMRIFRRSYNGTGYTWDMELDVRGSSHRCQRRGFPGVSVVINHDGSLVAVGAFNNETNQPAVSVYQYQTDNSQWILRDIVETGNNRTFLSLSGDGHWLAIGNPLWNTTHVNGTDRVTLLHYNSDAEEWEPMTTIPGDEENLSLGNGIGINNHATRLAVGHSGTHLQVYDIIHESDCQKQELPVYPFPDTSACEDSAITINSSSPVFHLGLSGNILAFEDSVGFDGKDTSVVKFFDIKNWTFAPLATENFTHTEHQDVIVAANGAIAAVLTKGDTDEEPDTIRVFRLNNNRADELSSIQGGKFEASMRGIAFNGDGTVIVAASYTLDDEGIARNHTIQAYSLTQKDGWVPVGAFISVSSAWGQFSLSKSGHVLAVGDSQFQVLDRKKEGHIRVFIFRDDEWELQAEFVGIPEEDENLGFSTAFNSEGTVLAVGVINGRDLYGVPEVGAVNVYHNINQTDGWTLRDRFSIGNRHDAFGYSLTLSGDGKRMAVGSFLPPPKRSKVRLFEYDERIGRWELIFADKGYSVIDKDSFEFKRYSFGQSVALNDDSTLMASGSAAPQSRRIPTPRDYVRVYNLSACLPSAHFQKQQTLPSSQPQH